MSIVCIVPGAGATSTRNRTALVVVGTNRTTAEIAQVIDILGGDVDAFTGKEYTSFYAHVLDEQVDTAIDLLTENKVSFVALTELGNPAERIAAVAEREGADEIVMGVGRHPAWLRWLNPSIARGVMERTDIPVPVLARGHVGALQRYGAPAGVAGVAAILWAVE